MSVIETDGGSRMSKLYATKRDVIEQEIIPVLAPLEGEYNLEAIASDVCTWEQVGFTVAEGDEFWAAVRRHAWDAEPRS